MATVTSVSTPDRSATVESRPAPFRWWLKWGSLLCAGVTGSSFLFRYGNLHPRAERSLVSFADGLQTAKDFLEIACLVVCVAIAFRRPLWGAARFERIERAFTAFACHRRQALLLTGLLPLLIRVSLLPVLPAPEPRVADEYGHLLIADTFASGRVTNPTHPMWRHFETLYVLQQPTYTSIYPFGQGLLLAAAKIVGWSPWAAVCLSAALMCSGICWMLQGWVPAEWALLGALAAIWRFSFLNYWMNSFWGGALAALGGALVVGALPRILKSHQLRHTLVLCAGLAILSQTRPFEGLILSLPTGAALLAWLFATRRVAWKTRMRNIVWPLVGSAALIFAAAGYYNWRVTGFPLLLPYQLHQKQYGTPQSFFWSAPVVDVAGIHRHKDILDNFRWQLKAYLSQASLYDLAKNFIVKCGLFQDFYLQFFLRLPLLFLIPALRERWTRFLALTMAFVWLGISLYPFFYAHYAAPICGMVVLATVMGLRRMRSFEWRSKPVGLFLFRSTIALSLLSFLIATLTAVLDPLAIVNRSTRNRLLDRLQQQGGPHLVLVRYNPSHSFHNPVVYNDANIDDSPVVWARELDAASNRELVRYFKGRKVWLFEPDEDPARLQPVDEGDLYDSPPHISAIVNAAGIQANSSEGVAPGEIVTIFGRNFAQRLEGTLTLGSIFWPLPLQIDKISMSEGNVYAPTYSIGIPDRTPALDTVFSTPLPTELANVRVQFGNVWAPIYTVANMDGEESITVQTPFEVGGATAAVTVWWGHYSTKAASVRIVPANPGVFQAQMSETSRNAVAVRPDGSFVADDNPAQRGEILRLLTTGLGPLTPPVATNHRGDSSDPRVQFPVEIRVNGVAAPVLAAKYAPGLIGIEEVDFRIPPDTASGRVPVVVAVHAGDATVSSNRCELPVR